MRRGIIRIIAGLALLILPLLAIIGDTFAITNTNLDTEPYFGLYSLAVAGIILLFYGRHVHRKYVYSKLILHINDKKIHIIMKWVGFVLSSLLFICSSVEIISSLPYFNIFTLLGVFSFLSFSVYSLFYMYKRPSCLFSATLIFIGVGYIYGIISNLTYYVSYLSDDSFVLYIFTYILPRLFTGILYLAIASIIYKESFSAKVVKNLGWIAFSLEILNRVVSPIIVLQRIYFVGFFEFIYLLFITTLMLYTSVFKVNTLRKASSSITQRAGTKWFTFYTKIRPWLACLTAVTVIADFMQHQELYTSYWWLMVYFLAALIQPVLCIMVFVKSQGNYKDFVCFVKGVLWFETINMAYGQAVQQYIESEFNIGVALVVGVIILSLGYFIWYRLNMKYFKKRIIVSTNDYSPNKANTSLFVYQNEALTVDVSRIHFCRKCGEKLINNSRFCRKCGTEIVEQ